MLNVLRFAGNTSSLRWFLRLAATCRGKLGRYFCTTVSLPLIYFFILCFLHTSLSNGKISYHPQSTFCVEGINTKKYCLVAWGYHWQHYHHRPSAMQPDTTPHTLAWLDQCPLAACRHHPLHEGDASGWFLGGNDTSKFDVKHQIVLWN